MFWGSLFWSGLMAWLLKWTLIGCLYILGAVAGFIGWINVVVIATMEWFLHVRHIYTGSREAKEAAKSVGEVFKSSKS
jgi:hypothetical protein